MTILNSRTHSHSIALVFGLVGLLGCNDKSGELETPTSSKDAGVSADAAATVTDVGSTATIDAAAPIDMGTMPPADAGTPPIS